MACRYVWCATDPQQHADDPTYHTREIGHGMLFAVNLEGEPQANWMPDWSEWTATLPDIDKAFDDVEIMLCQLKRDFRDFHDTLTGDPQFAAEVEAMKVKEGLS